MAGKPPVLDPRATERSGLGGFKYPHEMRVNWLRQWSKARNVYERETLEQVISATQAGAGRNLAIAAALVGGGILVAFLVR